MKVRKGSADDETVNVTVYEYFREKKIELTWSAYVPCLQVGKPKRPNYLPVEVIEINIECHFLNQDDPPLF